MNNDDTISVAIGPTAKQPTPAKLAQLADARKLALESRRAKQKQRLEIKLAELRRVMAGMSEDHMSRIATHMLAQEETLRGKQNELGLSINHNIQSFHDMMETQRRLLERIHDGLIPQSHTPRPPERRH